MVGTNRQASASSMAATGGSDSKRIGTSMPASRSTTPSSTRATASQPAPPASAALASVRAPCPYPSAFTTAHSSDGPTSLSSNDALRRAAPTSISAHAGLSRSTTATPPRLMDVTEVGEDFRDQDREVAGHH